MYKKINTEIRKIISEGWTDESAVTWGSIGKTHAIYARMISGTDNLPVEENTVYDLASV